MAIIVTEFPFILPIGYRDADGHLHKEGTMRPATAADEIFPLKDHRVQRNPAYLPIIVLTRVITRLGTLEMINTEIIEDLCQQDYNHLLDLYNEKNGTGLGG